LPPQSKDPYNHYALSRVVLSDYAPNKAHGNRRTCCSRLVILSAANAVEGPAFRAPMMRMERSVRMRHFRRSAGWPAPLFLSHRNLKVGAPFRPVLPGRGFRSPGEKAHPGHIGLGGAPEIKHFIRTPTAARPLSRSDRVGYADRGHQLSPNPRTIQSAPRGTKELSPALQR